MIPYRIYVLRKDGKTLSRVTIKLGSDEQAMQHALTLIAYDESAEIWQDNRCLGQIRNP